MRKEIDDLKMQTNDFLIYLVQDSHNKLIAKFKKATPEDKINLFTDFTYNFELLKLSYKIS